MVVTWQGDANNPTSPGDDQGVLAHTEQDLRYLLRSISEHASFVRKVHVVVPDNAVPTWLAKSNPKLNVVLHSSIFERAGTDLPTSNPLAIEANLHRIPGLTERFVHVTPGVFFASTVSKLDLFTPEGKPINHFLDAADDTHELQDVAAAEQWVVDNSNARLRDFFSKDLHVAFVAARPLPHTRALLRSSLQDAEEIFSQVLATTSHHKRVQTTDVSLGLLAASLALQRGDAVSGHWNAFEVGVVTGSGNVGHELDTMGQLMPKLVVVESKASSRASVDEWKAGMARVLPAISDFEQSE